MKLIPNTPVFSVKYQKTKGMVTVVMYNIAIIGYIRWDPTFQCSLYQKANVTPYIHVMVKHVPQQMLAHCGIKRFSCQGTSNM